jgi:hypothetical protein
LSRIAAPSTAPPKVPGYEYVKDIAEGASSVVYLYHQHNPSRQVAVKVLAERWQADAETFAQLGGHPHVVPVHTTGVAKDGRHYVVMAYCPGPNLLALALPDGLNVRKVVRAGIQIASAVEAAHNAHIVHRDIKPANILTDKLGARLTGFGIVGPLGVHGREDHALSVPWSPPEILDGAPAGVATDLYSLGATLWHLLAGHAPFQTPGSDTRAELEQRIRHVNAPPVGRADVPASLERLLSEMLAKNPARRPGSARQVLLALKGVEAELGGPAPAGDPWRDHLPRRAPAPELPEPEVKGGTRWWIWVGALAVVTLAGVVAAVHFGAMGSSTRSLFVAAKPAGGRQSAGAPADRLPPGVAEVTGTRVDAGTVEFTWIYSAPLATDTFQWRATDGRSQIATSTSVRLDAPAGAQICLEVKVIRADGSSGGSSDGADWSPEGCAL